MWVYTHMAEIGDHNLGGFQHIPRVPPRAEAGEAAAGWAGGVWMPQALRWGESGGSDIAACRWRFPGPRCPSDTSLGQRPGTPGPTPCPLRWRAESPIYTRDVSCMAQGLQPSTLADGGWFGNLGLNRPRLVWGAPLGASWEHDRDRSAW